MKTPTNKIIIEMMDAYAVIVSKNGVRCKMENKKLNAYACELVKRGILEERDIEYLNK